MPDPADLLYFKLLVVRCQAGDRFAIEELVARCQPRLRAFLAKMLPRSHSVDDASQDVWMDVFRDLKSLVDPGAFVPWMYRIARNRAFRVLRRSNLPTSAIDDVAMTQADEQDQFDVEDVEQVRKALDDLVPEHREVLLLRFIEDMSYDDIARVVQIPVGTVRSRIHNAKRTLRRIIEEQLQRKTPLPRTT